MSKEEINAFLGSGTAYEGKLTFQGAVRIDGSFKGEIFSEGALVVGKDATILGQLEIGELILSGVFEGEAKINRRVTIHKSGKYRGVLTTPAIIMEEGAIFDGKLKMSDDPRTDLDDDLEQA